MGEEGFAVLVTIGVYGFDGESFLGRLRQADVRLLLGVRQRRAVRSLVARRLAERHHLPVGHLLP